LLEYAKGRTILGDKFYDPDPLREEITVAEGIDLNPAKKNR